MKKRILLAALVALLFLPVSGWAQKASKNKNYVFTPGSDLSLSYGVVPIDATWGYHVGNLIYNYDAIYWDNYYPINQPSTGTGQRPLFDMYDNPNIRRGDGYISGAINFGYTYRFKRWFELTAYLSYSGYYATYYDAYTPNIAFKQNINSIGVMPFCRFVYLNRKYVKLYSGVGLGLSLSIISYKNASPKYDRTDSNEAFLGLNGSLNLIGIRVGNKVYGFADFSIGSLGFVNVGVGIKL